MTDAGYTSSNTVRAGLPPEFCGRSNKMEGGKCLSCGRHFLKLENGDVYLWTNQGRCWKIYSKIIVMNPDGRIDSFIETL